MTNPKFSVTSDSGRFYQIPGYENRTFYSVTTALNAISKPALMPWAAKLVAERAYEMMCGQRETPKGKAETLKVLKAAPKEYTEAAQKRGTAVHKACEEYTANPKPPGLYEAEIGPYVEAFADFLLHSGFTIVAQELTVFAPIGGVDYGYAGTLDAIVEKDGRYYVMDIKTGGVYPSASLQMAAYAYAPYKIDGNGVASPQSYEIDGAFVLELKPNKYTIHWMKIDEEQYDTFLHVLKVSIWNSEKSRKVIGDEYGPST